MLGLTIAYYLWWFYFAGDDERAEHVLARTENPRRQARLALQAAALALGGGAALYLLGHAWFKAQMGLRGVPHRLIAAVAVLATIPLGHVLAFAQLAAIPLITMVAAIVEDVPELRRTGRTEFGGFGRTTSPE